MLDQVDPEVDDDDEDEGEPGEEVIFHLPCAFNQNGVSERTCRETTVVLQRNVGCCQIQCGSAARACRVCILEPGEPNRVANRRSGLCNFHELHGEGVQHPVAEMPKPFAPVRRIVHARGVSVPAVQVPIQSPALPSTPRVATGTGRQILDRIRAAMANAQLITIDPARVRPMPDQPRKYFNEQRLLTLAESLRSYGQIMPGIVRAIPPEAEGFTHEILDGERRWRAVQVAGISYRAMLVDIDDEAAPFVVSVIANFNRAEHTLIEIADSIKVMMEDLKLTQAEIGEAMGMHPVQVSRHYGLKRLVPEVRDLLDPNLYPDRKKRLKNVAAFELALLAPTAQVKMAQALMSGEISITDLRQHALTSPDRVAAHHRKLDPHERWRTILRRAEAIESKVTDFSSVLKTIQVPESVGSGHSSVLTRKVLKRVVSQLEAAIGKLPISPSEE